MADVGLKLYVVSYRTGSVSGSSEVYASCAEEAKKKVYKQHPHGTVHVYATVQVPIRNRD
jgi:hypothetical protein